MENSVTFSSSNNPSSSKQIDFLFSRFAAFYGYIWRNQFKDEGFLKFAKKEWAEGLKDFSEQTLNQAMLHARDSWEMPPTLPQMIGYCRHLEKFKLKQEVEVKHIKVPEEIAQGYFNEWRQLLEGKHHLKNLK